jgi:hypothetical protein
LVDDVLGLFLARGDHRGDRLAGKAHFAGSKDRLADRLVVELMQHRRDRLEAFHVGGGNDPGAIRRLDVFDLPRSNRASHKTYPMCRG